MNKLFPPSIVFSFIATSFLTYLSIKPAMELPDFSPFWREVTWIALSVVCGALTNAFIYLRAVRIENDRLKIRNDIYPIITRNLDELLVRRKSEILEHLHDAAAIDMYAFWSDGNFHRVLGSSEDPSAQTRNLALVDNEGVVGFCFRDGSTVFLHDPTGGDVARTGRIYNRRGDDLQIQPKISDSKLNKIRKNIHAIVATPIYSGVVGDNLDDRRVVGVLTVDGIYKGAYKDFQSDDFVKLVEGVALDVGPFLEAKAFLQKRLET